jgi:hypothetical protein
LKYLGHGDTPSKRCHETRRSEAVHLRGGAFSGFGLLGQCDDQPGAAVQHRRIDRRLAAAPAAAVLGAVLPGGLVTTSVGGFDEMLFVTSLVPFGIFYFTCQSVFCLLFSAIAGLIISFVSRRGPELRQPSLPSGI